MTRILVTGASGAVGSAFLSALTGSDHEVVATDLRRPADLPDCAQFVVMDVSGPEVQRVIGEIQPDVVVHLASIVNPTTRDVAYAVDVTGSRNIIDACVHHGVRRLVVTSSGAAYGYHADNPDWLVESDALRGNPEFAYADHKRQVEEMLAQTRKSAPDLEQVVLRVGTVLGAGMENQITALFHKPRLLAIAGSDSPFVFIGTDDLAQILLRAVTDGPPGIYNVAADGTMRIDDLSQVLKKPVIRLPAWALKAVLFIARPLGLSRYGPEQVRFLQYRPVLDNTALKSVFGYAPKLCSAEVFEQWRKGAGL